MFMSSVFHCRQSPSFSSVASSDSGNTDDIQDELEHDGVKDGEKEGAVEMNGEVR